MSSQSLLNLNPAGSSHVQDEHDVTHDPDVIARRQLYLDTRYNETLLKKSSVAINNNAQMAVLNASLDEVTNAIADVDVHVQTIWPVFVHNKMVAQDGDRLSFLKSVTIATLQDNHMIGEYARFLMSSDLDAFTPIYEKILEARIEVIEFLKLELFVKQTQLEQEKSQLLSTQSCYQVVYADLAPMYQNIVVSETQRLENINKLDQHVTGAANMHGINHKFQENDYESVVKFLIMERQSRSNAPCFLRWIECDLANNTATPVRIKMLSDRFDLLVNVAASRAKARQCSLRTDVLNMLSESDQKTIQARAESSDMDITSTDKQHGADFCEKKLFSYQIPSCFANLPDFADLLLKSPVEREELFAMSERDKLIWCLDSPEIKSLPKLFTDYKSTTTLPKRSSTTAKRSLTTTTTTTTTTSKRPKKDTHVNPFKLFLPYNKRTKWAPSKDKLISLIKSVADPVVFDYKRMSKSTDEDVITQFDSYREARSVITQVVDTEHNSLKQRRTTGRKHQSKNPNCKIKNCVSCSNALIDPDADYQAIAKEKVPIYMEVRTPFEAFVKAHGFDKIVADLTEVEDLNDSSPDDSSGDEDKSAEGRKNKGVRSGEGRKPAAVVVSGEGEGEEEKNKGVGSGEEDSE